MSRYVPVRSGAAFIMSARALATDESLALRNFAQAAMRQPVMPARHPLLPFGTAIAGIATFSAMDAVMKSAALAAGVYTEVLLRNAIGSGLMLPVWLAAGRPMGHPSDPVQ